MIHLSVVSPVYKAENIVHELVCQLHENISKITENYEIILVNDSSPDNSWSIITEECKKDKRVKGLNFSRNFGQHYAITAGLSYATGEWVVVMDCDLQDRPDEIPNLYQKAKEGWDIVFARREQRKDSFTKRFSSKLFHAVYSFLSGIKSDPSISNFGIYSTHVINEYSKMPERARSFPSLIAFLGFKSCSMRIKHSERLSGKSSYSFIKLLKLSFDVIISNSNRPLYFAVSVGLIMSIIAFLLAIYNIIANLSGLVGVAGFTTTIFSIWFVGGLTLFTLGVVGLYIGLIFDQSKGRPMYIVKDTLNLFKK